MSLNTKESLLLTSEKTIFDDSQLPIVEEDISLERAKELEGKILKDLFKKFDEVLSIKSEKI